MGRNTLPYLIFFLSGLFYWEVPKDTSRNAASILVQNRFPTAVIQVTGLRESPIRVLIRATISVSLWLGFAGRKANERRNTKNDNS